MREIAANAWEVDCDVLCITTNCTVRESPGGSIRYNVMGGGIARAAAARHTNLPVDYAKLIDAHGHHVFLLGALLMFPTKDEVRENSTLHRIGMSISETQALANIYGWNTIALPRPGSGLGGLSWEREVKPFLERLGVDDRFLIVSFPGEN